MCRCICAQLAVRARDPFWHEVLYGTLIDLGAVRELLELDGSAPGLEAILRSHGGLTGSVPGVPVGPLSSRQACICSLAYGPGLSWQHISMDIRCMVRCQESPSLLQAVLRSEC